MHCEFCDVTLSNLAEARRHMVTIAHIRNKRNYDLAIDKYLERSIQATLRPKNFQELTKLLNLHSPKDVEALNETKFFKITTVTQSKVVSELINILYENSKEYSYRRLPEEIREPLVKLIAESLLEDEQIK